MRKILALSLVIIMASCNSAKKGTSATNAKYTLENLEKLDSKSLRSQYPNANIKEGTDLFEEGTEKRAFSILYPGTPDELSITWQDEERTKIHDIRYSGNGKWKSETGIDIGTSYEALNKINAKKISFYGFGWDYSGAVLWNGGKMEDSKLRVFLAPQNEHSNKFYGDQIIKASDAEIEALDLKVSSIIINYAI
ncbi:hypothetical protein [Christiangramia salexigens]|uniref:Lipoprotein n=1 Tax=Christiangramia salexigens TaxID=1913577 RepID=A0A1L3J741_9FLAO|nr:hypothetical protein [Christiangramia salexigens]APG60956.1 hypothetical protein LPB144_11280 [Christiangramia salexigens]